MLKRLIPLLLTVLLISGMGVASFASAHPVPDLTQTGSIEITMHAGDTNVGGGTLTLYRVGEVHEDDGNYSFLPTGDFADCGESFDDLSSHDLADRLADYASDHSVEGTAATVGSDGKVSFGDLELGLYLVVQKEAAEGYNKANPFLVSVPKLENGAYDYTVEATPKVELTPAPPDEPDEPDKPDGPNLPQTGQLNWPVPVLTVAGLGLFAVGFKLFSSRKKENDEK